MEALRLAFVVRPRWTVVTALEALARMIIEQRKVILTVHMFRTRRQIELFHTGGASVAVLAKT